MHGYYKLGDAVQVPTFNRRIRDQNYAPFQFEKVQTYQPIFKNLFRTAARKRQRRGAPADHPLHRMVLNHRLHLVDETTVCDAVSGAHTHRRIYFKFAPLLSPIGYLLGEYGEYTRDSGSLLRLPAATDDPSSSRLCAKLFSPFNSGYVDAFCSYLCGQLRATRGIFPALEFYGSFSAVQKMFRMHMTDVDSEDVESSAFFERGLGRHFHEKEIPEWLHADADADADLCSVATSTPYSRRASLRRRAPRQAAAPAPDALSDLESVSSGSAATGTGGGDFETASEGASSAQTDDSETVCTVGPACAVPRRRERFADCAEDLRPLFIESFPVQIIAMEQCEGTLDDLVLQNRLGSPLAKVAMLFQVAAYLAVLQRELAFTHNDLHSNNVFWSSTQEPHFHYRVGDRNFRVPTFGRMFRVGDFGRAIFTYGETVYASDHFFPGGDAEQQYNCEPFFNPALERIDRNFSADLCRLATSLFDYEFLSPSDAPENDYQTLLRDWCLDDGGAHMLWTRDGRKRYRQFKLYKMISRRVHDKIPRTQLLARPEFQQFRTDDTFDDTTTHFFEV